MPRTKHYVHKYIMLKKDTNGTLELQWRKCVTAIGQDASHWQRSISSPTLVCSLGPCQQISEISLDKMLYLVIMKYMLHRKQQQSGLKKYPALMHHWCVGSKCK